jgi:DNA (cytosine-5)-methyltransferase 1
LNTEKKVDDYYYFDVEKNRYGEMIWAAVKKGDRESIYQLRRSYVREYRDVMPTLTANMGDGGHNVPTIVDEWGLRKLTPEECARYQGFEGDFADLPKDLGRPQLYKQIGNSVTIPLVEKLAHGCAEMLQDKTLVRRA